ncbi:hypothetical protein PPACK8108_LOCUS17689 [Phakopsora pachyrhizi]|uniref:Uncharacterized protein n=1 Tax=Phakopsora pachyrhizi TaxID=170000 RepID=A0AAV0B9M9_PHAPC|nr:hypothetical protein PPACK8108_LOCUS17689 [Phakopsora pachyrhizi]
MWPSHSKKSSCALCGYLFSFEMVYKSPPFLLCVSSQLKNLRRETLESRR